MIAENYPFWGWDEIYLLENPGHLDAIALSTRFNPLDFCGFCYMLHRPACFYELFLNLRGYRGKRSIKVRNKPYFHYNLLQLLKEV
jgi:hypothetical protein